MQRRLIWRPCWVDLMFDAALRMAAGIVQSVMDEVPCRLLPMRRILGPNSGLEADTSRAEFDFVGCLHRAPVRSAGETARQVGGVARQMNGEMVLSALDADWPFDAQKTDMVEVPEGRFKIAEIHRDGSLRVFFYLNRA